MRSLNVRQSGRSLVGVISGIFLMAMFFAVTAPPTAQAWTPSKPIEFVVQASPGGGSDVLARTISSIMEAEKLSPVPFVVVNKPGGASIVGTTYVAQQKGNPEVIATYHLANLQATLTAGVEAARLKNMTMLVALAIDEQLLVVRADSPFKTAQDIVAAAKKNPGTLTAGGTAAVGDDTICNRLLEQSAGVKIRYVPFNSGGETMTALLGGHVDMIWANPAEFSPQLDAKQVRPLAVAKPERASFLKDVPTFKEQGFDVTWQVVRGVIGPSGLTDENIAFYETAFKKMTESDRWKEGYLKKYQLAPGWMDHKTVAKFMADQEKVMEAILKETGLLK